MPVTTAARRPPAIPARTQHVPQARRGPTHVGPLTLDQVKGYFVGEALTAALKNEERTKSMVQALASYAEHDSYSTLNMVRVGEIYYNFLLQPAEVQMAFTTKMAELQGIAAPSYTTERKQGRAETGRNQLAAVIYGKHPEMFEIKAGSRDTLAGKRVSAALRAYKVKAGLIRPRERQEGAQQPIPKTGAQMFVTLLGVATDDEVELLDELARRAGIDDVTIARWHRNLEQALQAEPEVAAETKAA